MVQHVPLVGVLRKLSDSAYCYCCRHFGVDTSADRRQCQGQDVFTHNGYRAWNRCTGSDPKTNAFLLHKNCEEHRFAVERQQAYGSTSATGKTVVDLLDSEHRKQVINITVSNSCLFYNFKVSQCRRTMAVNLRPFNKCTGLNSLESSNTNGGAFIFSNLRIIGYVYHYGCSTKLTSVSRCLQFQDVRQVYSVELLAVAGSVCVVARGST